MITEIDDYFAKGCGRCDRFDTPECSALRWALGLAELRALCRGAGLTEAVKWGHPCYTLEGRNIVIIGAFRDDFRLTFFNAGLMKDPEGVLQYKGANTRTADMIRFGSGADVTAQQDLIRAYLQEAVRYAKAGIKAPKVQAEFDLPDELVAALDDDPALAEAFQALTPGRQRSYVIHLNGAKASATRTARILRCVPKILAGKGQTER